MTNYTNNDEVGTDLIRCATYGRYSSDEQKRTSIDDQVRNCRDAAAEKKWEFLPEFVRSDEGISGAALTTREGIKFLIAEAKKCPRPFDCVLIDDTSRLGRNLSDVLRVTDILRFNGIFLYFVTQCLDSRDPSFRMRLIMYGMQDEDFLVGLSHRVHRGMKGVMLAGHHTGGKRYGYRSVLIPDPIRKDEHGRPAIAYVLLEIDEDEARIVRKIFEMKVSGKSLVDITKHLNSQNIPGPTGRGWSYATIRRILGNELYRGIVKWNLNKNVRNPESGIVRQRKRTQKDWISRNDPNLQVIEDDLWNRVQEHNQRMKRIGKQQLGGFNRTESSRKNLFSGRLRCGLCNRMMTIIASSKRTARYGCPRHRYEALCSNGLTIRRDTLEEQLLSAIIEKLHPDVLERAIDGLQTELEEYLNKELNAEPVDRAALEKRLVELTGKQSNITAAIASYGHSESLLTELERIDTELASIRRHLSASVKPARGEGSFDELRAFAMKRATGVKDLLRSDPAAAREALGQVISELVLTPTDTQGGAVYVVTGDVQLFAENPSVMLSRSVDQNAKHYTSLLSLTGLQLDPRKTVQAIDPQGSEVELCPPPSFMDERPGQATGV